MITHNELNTETVLRLIKSMNESIDQSIKQSIGQELWHLHPQ